MQRKATVGGVGVRLGILALGAWAAAACGQVTQVLTSPSGTGGGGNAFGPDGGGGGSGASELDGATASGGAGDGVSTDAGNAFDPHHDERERLVHDYCGILDTYPCLGYAGTFVPGPPSGSAEDRRKACELDLGARTFIDVPDACWDDWVATVQCDVTIVRSCPCGDASAYLNSDSDCQLGSDVTRPWNKEGVLPPGIPCAVPKSNLNNCLIDQIGGEPFHKVQGSRGMVEYSQSNTGCRLDTTNGVIGLNADCKGPPGGPYQCLCSTATGAPQYGTTFYARTCEDAAKQIAEGECYKYFDCCVKTWRDGGSGLGTYTDCECTTDPVPTLTGADLSCDAYAGSVGGTRVNFCPQY